MSQAYELLIKDADAYFRKLFETGWVDEWDEAEIDKLHEALKDAAAKEPRQMLFVLSEYSLDPEGFRTSEDYKGFLVSLFRSFELDLPTESVIAEKMGMISLAVKTPKGTTVTYSADFEDDWLSDDFFDFINDELLPEWGEERMFYVLPPAEAQAEIVFQYVEVIEAAIDGGIIPDDDYFVSE